MKHLTQSIESTFEMDFSINFRKYAMNHKSANHDLAKQIRICNMYFPISYLIEKMSPLWIKRLKPLHLVSYLKKRATWLFSKRWNMNKVYLFIDINSLNLKIKIIVSQYWFQDSRKYLCLEIVYESYFMYRYIKVFIFNCAYLFALKLIFATSMNEIRNYIQQSIVLSRSQMCLIMVIC